ncbi:phage-shock protein [Desulfofundulus thermobenzoicus]|uniref:Phage-shock protein n=1 Tax=Desulfofundulus thermobenzoicus TaxID=29376 RepID=A0A6N7IMP9_9FIRM|nr:phage-shock protein [Desulfofundulus thermobenzoicus]MQL51204.1 phage-shock protein [Desulfofundulus thermobenzoicus]
MEGKLHSLTDVLKKTLFFFDSLTVTELVPYVHRRMLRDYTLTQVEEKVALCLRQHACFYMDNQNAWHLDLEGERENDGFYSLLLKKQQPLSIRELKSSASRNKKNRHLVADEARLISDGRFIQLDNGSWGLTEWEVESGQYALKHLVIKALKSHPTGLSQQQIYELVSLWRSTTLPAVEGVLRKFPYFEVVGEGVWTYNPVVRAAYEALTRRYLGALNRQKLRWHRDRERWRKKVVMLDRQLQEVTAAHREAAAALAQRADELSQHEYLVTQMAEKDLLLSLRKKEIFRYREHINKLEAKANSILHQCRLWVKRARDGEQEIAHLRQTLAKNQASLESLFTKLQQYKERDRENKGKLAELKERHANRVAELQTEIVELRQKLERTQDLALQGERQLREEINSLSNDLKDALEKGEEARRSLRFIQKELSRCQEEYRRLQGRLKNPLVRLAVRICSWFDGSAGHLPV